MYLFTRSCLYAAALPFALAAAPASAQMSSGASITSSMSSYGAASAGSYSRSSPYYEGTTNLLAEWIREHPQYRYPTKNPECSAQYEWSLYTAGPDTMIVRLTTGAKEIAISAGTNETKMGSKGALDKDFAKCTGVAPTKKLSAELGFPYFKDNRFYTQTGGFFGFGNELKAK